jgi:hypothetical protein
MVMNKKGWLRIMEAFLAVMIIVGAIAIIYTNQRGESGESAYIKDLQNQIIQDISQNEDLRNAILSNDASPLNEFINKSIPASLNFTIKICAIDAVCALETTAELVKKDIYAQERVISGSLSVYNPKRFRLFVWRI